MVFISFSMLMTLLLSHTLCELHNVSHMCERELDALDLTINVKKTCCLRIGARNKCRMSASGFSVWYICAMNDRDQIFRYTPR